ncbi:MAG TPA: hypothetical protein VK793_19470 [Steroidobacteraceae bacterium]|jgi:hypothetical protein|nr:hypothetical protein [Steroidobacteraceae bacterium]
MRLRIALCQVALLLLSVPAPAAELFYMDHDAITGEYVGPVGPLVMSGEIIPGDYDRLLSKILDDPGRFLAQNKLILASDGGDMSEAIKIATLIRSLFAAVTVGPLTGRCVSACFFIYASAAQREADGARLVGINRPYLVDSPAAPATVPRPDVDDSKALRQVRAFLQDNAVPGYLVDEMFRHPSDDAYWLSAEDEKALGFRSPAFDRYLAVNCAWSETIEREVLARKRPPEDLLPMLKCRARVTEDAARRALALAAKERSGTH